MPFPVQFAFLGEKHRNTAKLPDWYLVITYLIHWILPIEAVVESRRNSLNRRTNGLGPLFEVPFLPSVILQVFAVYVRFVLVEYSFDFRKHLNLGSALEPD